MKFVNLVSINNGMSCIGTTRISNNNFSIFC